MTVVADPPEGAEDQRADPDLIQLRRVNRNHLPVLFDQRRIDCDSEHLLDVLHRCRGRPLREAHAQKRVRRPAPVVPNHEAPDPPHRIGERKRRSHQVGHGRNGQLLSPDLPDDQRSREQESTVPDQPAARENHPHRVFDQTREVQQHVVSLRAQDTADDGHEDEVPRLVRILANTP